MGCLLGLFRDSYNVLTWVSSCARTGSWVKQPQRSWFSKRLVTCNKHHWRFQKRYLTSFSIGPMYVLLHSNCTLGTFTEQLCDWSNTNHSFFISSMWANRGHDKSLFCCQWQMKIHMMVSISNFSHMTPNVNVWVSHLWEKLLEDAEDHSIHIPAGSSTICWTDGKCTGWYIYEI